MTNLVLQVQRKYGFNILVYIHSYVFTMSGIPSYVSVLTVGLSGSKKRMIVQYICSECLFQIHTFITVIGGRSAEDAAFFRHRSARTKRGRPLRR